MTLPIDSANVYTDFEGLDKLRLSADKRDPKAMEAAAKQFEALFVQQMLKSMRDASLSDGLFDGEESRFYLDMFDKQMSLTMTKGEGMGLAKMIIQQLQSTVEQVDALKQKEDSEKLQARLISGAELSVSLLHKATPDGEAAENVESKANVATPVQSSTESKLGVPSPETDDISFNSPAEFVHNLWPHAQRVAKVLGVDPRVLVAQSALETGWGKHMTRHPDGRSSNNYFNIKADQRWQGDTVSLTTLEFHDGIPSPEKASFRAYDSMHDSFDDYAKFIQSSSRYHAALQQASNLEQYTQELQHAGFASDPEYSNKIMNIIKGSPLNEALETVKLSMNETITLKGGSK